VHLDRVEVGRTPLELAVLPGEHHIAVVLAGHREESEVVHIERPGETVSLSYALDEAEGDVRAVADRRRGGRDRSTRGGSEVAPTATGMLAITTVPTWSEVFEGGRSLGVTPLRASLPAGHHRLTLRPEGHGSRSVEVDIAAGETTRLRVDL
jgi:hypothetical protein